MGRHSDERDTATNGPESSLSATEPLGSPTGRSPGSPDADGRDDLSLFDPDDCALWNFEPLLRQWEWYGDDSRPIRAIVDVPLPDPDDFERCLREKYEPLCTPEEYQQLRRRCGLGKLIEGRVSEADQ